MKQASNQIPHYSIRGLVNFLINQGLEQQVLLSMLDCSLSDLNTPKKTFYGHDYERLLEIGSAQLALPNIGFLHGKYFHPSAWGLLGNIVEVSENLWQALGYQKRYQCLMGTFGRAYHELDDESVIMRWLSEPNASNNNIEQVITAWVSFAFANTISNEKPLSVHFMHSPLAALDDYEAFFGCPVFFNANFNGVIIREKSLRLPLIHQNKEVLDVLCCHAEHQLSHKKANASLDIVSQLIVEMLPKKVPELADIAEHLSISTRQLQRKFEKEGTNLTSLLEDIRKRLAISYLCQTDHKLLYISTVLGYSEQSAFQRAFKRWTGQTPQSFRLSPIPIS